MSYNSPTMIRANTEAFVIFQYSNGIGHLNRCSTIAKAFSAISHVTMFSGGRPIDGYSPPAGVDFIQLPAIHWDGTVDALPVPVDPSYTLAETEQMRSELLVEYFIRIKPRIVIVEFYPFSPRRTWRKAMDRLFDAISEGQHRPIVICSIRTYPRLWDTDIDPAWINEQLRKNYSCVLHHADPKLFPLISLGSYVQTALSGISVWQTGFVRRPLIQMDHDRPINGLLLTVGGGGHRSAAKMLKRWINAARAGSPDLFPINTVCGPMMDTDNRKIVHAERDTDIIVHDWVANLDELIASSRAVVCMGGYNTLVEALSLEKPVLAFPGSDAGDQTFQVNALHSQGVLLKGDQTQSELEITALMNQLLRFRPQHTIDCDGANRSVEIVQQLLLAKS
jgi:predicted glycosyltransferase